MSEVKAEIVSLEDGKYELEYHPKSGELWCLRYGEAWRNLVGDNMVLALFQEVLKLRKQVDELRGGA